MICHSSRLTSQIVNERLTVEARLFRHAPWRKKPASEKQLQMFRKLKGIDPGSTEGDVVQILGKKVAWENLTSGEVASFL